MSGKLRYEVDRGLDVAISEYAPGRAIVVDKKPIKSVDSSALEVTVCMVRRLLLHGRIWTICEQRIYKVCKAICCAENSEFLMKKPHFTELVETRVKCGFIL